MTTPQPPLSGTSIASQEEHTQFSVMAASSIYCAECLCGRYFESASRDWICPDCHRHIFLDWGHCKKEAKRIRSQNDSSTTEAR